MAGYTVHGARFTVQGVGRRDGKILCDFCVVIFAPLRKYLLTTKEHKGFGLLLNVLKYWIYWNTQRTHFSFFYHTIFAFFAFSTLRLCVKI